MLGAIRSAASCGVTEFIESRLDSLDMVPIVVILFLFLDCYVKVRVGILESPLTEFAVDETVV